MVWTTFIEIATMRKVFVSIIAIKRVYVCTKNPQSDSQNKKIRSLE